MLLLGGVDHLLAAGGWLRLLLQLVRELVENVSAIHEALITVFVLIVVTFVIYFLEEIVALFVRNVYRFVLS